MVAEIAEPTWYRAVISGDGVPEIPFFLRLNGDEDAVVRNGSQDLGGGSVTWEGPAGEEGSEVAIEYGLFHMAIRAQRRDGGLRGSFESRSKSWGHANLDFVAEEIDMPAPSLRFAGDGDTSHPVDAGGVFRVEFDDGSGIAKLILEQQETAITGTIHFQTGNFVYLAGNERDGEVLLSSFDGSSPYLMRIDISGDSLTGRWIAGHDLSWREDFSGVREEDFDWKPKIGSGTLPTTLDVAPLDDPRFEGSPVIVELAGSWCSSCKYAAPVLSKLYDTYHPEGLEIVTLSYEFTDDEDYNRRQAEAFASEYGIEWDVVPVHGGLDVYADIMPPGLETVNAAGFPVAIFLDREGVVRGIHAGFPSPAAEDAHHATIEEYERLIRDIVDGDGSRAP